MSRMRRARSCYKWLLFMLAAGSLSVMIASRWVWVHIPIPISDCSLVVANGLIGFVCGSGWRSGLLFPSDWGSGGSISLWFNWISTPTRWGVGAPLWIPAVTFLAAGARLFFIDRRSARYRTSAPIASTTCAGSQRVCRARNVALVSGKKDGRDARPTYENAKPERTSHPRL